MGYIRAAAVLLPVLAGATIGALLLCPLALPLLLFPWSRGLFHWWVDTVKTQWFILVTMQLELIGGIKIHIYGDDIADAVTGKSIPFVICNHRTRIDWMVLWSFFIRCAGNKLGILKIILKEDLKKLPLFGWAMSYFRFIFLSRKWEDDQGEIKLLSQYYDQTSDPTCCLIFPEGTDLSIKNIKRAHDFAEKNGKEKFEYVLNPRSKGTHYLLSKMRNNTDTLWDLTMGYKDRVEGERPSEMMLAKGYYPQEVHILVNKYPLSDIPTDADKFATWLDSRFAHKEQKLKHFYSNKYSFSEKRQQPISLKLQYVVCVCYWVLCLFFTLRVATSWYVFFIFYFFCHLLQYLRYTLKKTITHRYGILCIFVVIVSNMIVGSVDRFVYSTAGLKNLN